MATEQEQLRAGIAALEAQRGLLGDGVADAALTPLRARLLALTATQPAEAAQTLKQVTILFLDVVGSTTLSQRLDPEDNHAVMDKLLANCTTIVESHRGKVLQYAGDSLLAVFGADEVREDDPEWAVYCGLALVSDGHSLSEEIWRRYRHEGFNVRVGVHTGSVLLGGGVDPEGSVRGIAVSIAARMEQTAPAGSLRISRDTYRHVRGLFDVEAQSPLAVKGLDEPFVTYLVKRAKRRAFQADGRGVEGVTTRTVGRDAEIEGLRGAFNKARSGARLATVVVAGEAGVGKSRLLYEFEKWLRLQPEGFAIFQGRATPQTEHQPYGLLRDILAWWVQIDDGDTMSVAKSKIERSLSGLFKDGESEELSQAHTHILGHLIGLDFSESEHIRAIGGESHLIRERGFHAAFRLFREIAARDGAPIVLLLEDLHWADSASLNFLEQLTRVNCDVPMLLLGLTRPTLFERLPEWLGSAEVHRIELAPLDEDTSRRLADELLKKLPEVPAELRTLITSGAEGNPFYMEELVNMLIDKGAIEAAPERWTLRPERLLTAHVPQTLTGVLQARLDGLPTSERTALQAASVIGVVFWDQALAAVDRQASLSLPALVRRALTLPRQDASLEGMREYVFRHHILHQVTYDTLLKQTRRELHAKVAAWLTSLTDASTNELLGVTAEHYERAGDHERAAEFYARAAEHACDRYAHEATLAYADRGLLLVDGGMQPHQLELRWRMLREREHVLGMRGRSTEQRACLDELQALAELLDDDGKRGRVLLWRSFRGLTDDVSLVAALARQAAELGSSSKDETLELHARRQLAIATASLGDLGGASSMAKAALTQARSSGLAIVEMAVLGTLEYIANLQGDLMGALDLALQVLTISRQLHHRTQECGALCGVAFNSFELGDYVTARRNLQEALPLARGLGDRHIEAYALKLLSNVALSEGDKRESLSLAHAALEIAQQAQADEELASALCSLGNAELALGSYQAAAHAFERAASVAAKAGDPFRHDATAGRARAALDGGDLGRASDYVERLLTEYYCDPRMKGAARPALIDLTCWKVLVRLDDPRAPDLLARAHVALQDRAALISDLRLRHGFLNGIQEHQEIVTAWAAQQAQSTGHS